MTVKVIDYTAPVADLQPGFKPQAGIGWSNYGTGLGLLSDGSQGGGFFAKEPYPSTATVQRGSASGQYVFSIGHINDAGRWFGDILDGTMVEAATGIRDVQQIAKPKCSKTVYSQSVGSTGHGVMFLGGRRMKAAVGDIVFDPTGSLSVTGLGFQPQLLIFHSAQRPSVASEGSGGAFSYGATDGVNQWALAWDSPYLVDGDTDPSQMQTGRWMNDRCAISVQNPSMLAEVEITSLDSDGFTVNVISADSNYFSYLALSDPDGDFAVGEGTQDDASITVGFAADAMLFASGLTADHALSVAFAGSAIGGADPATQVGGCTAQRINNADRYWNTSALAMIDTGTGGPSLKAEMVVDGWNPTTVDLDWTTTDSLGRLFGWIAFRTTGKRGCGHPLPRMNAGR